MIEPDDDDARRYTAVVKGDETHQECIARLTRERDEARADLHLLKRAVSPSRAGHAPWEGMPDITYFVGVALRHRDLDRVVFPARGLKVKP